MYLSIIIQYNQEVSCAGNQITMEQYIQTIKTAKLFDGLSQKDTYRLLACLKAQPVEYARDTVVVEEGCPVKKFGILLRGRGRSYKTDSQGHTLTVTLLKEGSEIGVILAASPGRKSPVSVTVEQGSSVLFISYNRLINNCTRNCPCHRQLLKNFMWIVAEKGLVLHERLDCLLRPTARDKILTYLKKFSDSQTGVPFTIPLDRNAMAEYLNMDRSALSRELSCMKTDGIIDFYKSTFRLLNRC